MVPLSLRLRVANLRFRIICIAMITYVRNN